MTPQQKIAGFSFIQSIKDQKTVDAITQLLLKHEPCLEKISDVWIDSTFNIKRPSDFWYSGAVAAVSFGNLKFVIEATGDQRYNLYIRDYAKFVERYKDRIDNFEDEDFGQKFSEQIALEEYVNKGGSNESFLDVFGKYFDNDQDFIEQTDSETGIFVLECNNNNWLETICVDVITKNSICLTDIFCGMDIGYDVFEEVTYILENSDAMIADNENKLNTVIQY